MYEIPRKFLFSKLEILVNLGKNSRYAKFAHLPNSGETAWSEAMPWYGPEAIQLRKEKFSWHVIYALKVLNEENLTE
ncbi:hypothetical protein Y032_0781g2306 [Ancylostoma ceylanicum]|uniref:Uncharacterized protein n=1 Tax=Ancylostoma ceylanicum TaxID=53326 RepID=A0A016WF04_9BILA|nr:hypothetical protein Y032_0781g2306 [Ancylostoma ceylanicum]